jgi:protein-disulfide isomerase
MVRRIVTAVALSAFCVAVLFAQSRATTGGKPLAVVNGETVTEQQVKDLAAKDLENLELHKLQADAGYERDQHAIVERALEGIIQDKLLEAEAKKRGVTPQALITSEVDSKVIPPSNFEVTAFYETNKSRISVSGDEALRQIKAYLTDQRREAALESFVATLKKEYKVETYLEPLRSKVETEGSPAKGPAAAPVTIVEFSDFECPFCGALFPTLKQIEAKYGDKLRIVFRQFPLTNIHPHAQKAAEASLCANEQKKFWEMHDAMFQDNKNLEVDALKQKASALKLDRASFDACLDSAKYAAAIKKDTLAGAGLGVTGTPAMFINGRLFGGVLPFENLVKIIDEELQKKN